MSSSAADDNASSPSSAKSIQTPPRPATKEFPSCRRLNENPMVITSPQRPRPSAFRQGSFYFPGAELVSVGSSSGGVAGGLAQGSLVAQKRKYREGSASPVKYRVSNKAFRSKKALFVHMKSHPDRGWKGAHPPPALKAEEEFAYMPEVNLHVLAEAAVEVAFVNEDAVEEGEIVEEEVGQLVERVSVQAEGGQQKVDNGEQVGPQAGVEAEAQPVYLLPDLNDIPPPEEDDE